MCLPGQPPAAPAPSAPSAPPPPVPPAGPAPPDAPASAAEAVAMARAGLAWLARADAAGLTAAEQADCLRALEAAEAAHTAARARVLAAFHAGNGCQDDGHGSAKSWLRWQTRITTNAAATAMAWMRRLGAHPAVAGALAAGDLSPSWARAVCGWTDLLPAEHRAGADAILLAAAASGADLAGLAQLAEEIRRRTARPDTDGDDGFKDRSVSLDVTFGQAGKLTGNLTPQCTAALLAVLDALGKKTGPEDTRTVWQRRHDAVEEMCRRLIAAGGVPDRAGQPAQIQVHMTLDQLRGLTEPGARGQAGWAAAWPPAGPGADCDASIVPVVTGHLDHQLLSQLAAELLGGRTSAGQNGSGQNGSGQNGSGQNGSGQPGSGLLAACLVRACPARARAARPGSAARARAGRMPAAGGGCGPSGPPGSSSSPARSACCPGPAGWPATCGPGCPMTWSRRSACRWTSARSPTPSRCTCAGRSPSGTGTAGSPAAPSPPRHASRTTSSPAPRAARPA